MMPHKNQVEIWRLISSSYGVLVTHWLKYLKLVAVPFVVLFLLGIGILYVDSIQSRSLVSIGFQWLVPVVMIPVVTSWHRLILLGVDEEGSRIGYKYGAEEWVYFKALIVLVIAFFVTNFLLGIILGPILAGLAQFLGSAALAGVYRLILLLVVFLIVCRFLLVLPAAALGKKMDIAKSSLAMQGSALRLTAAYVLALIAPEAILLVTGTVTDIVVNVEGRDLWSSIGLLGVSLVVEMAFYTLSVGVLSYAYKALVLDDRTSEMETRT